MKPMLLKVLGIPFSFGQGKPGVKSAPAALRGRGLLHRLGRFATVQDLGDLDFELCEGRGHGELILQEAGSALGTELISQCVEGEDLKDTFLLSVGGDHGLALGTIHGLLRHDPNTIVVWADAHGDINTPTTSPSGNFHGMPLAFLLGLVPGSETFAWVKRIIAPRNLILMGPRDLDEGEKRIIRELSIQYYSSLEINCFGAERLLRSALFKADPTESVPIHLSFDMDLFDADDIQSTGTRVPNGPRFTEIFSLGRALGKTGRLRSMDLVELNPELGDEEEVLESVQLAIEFVEAVVSSCTSEVIADWPRSHYGRASSEENLRK